MEVQANLIESMQEVDFSEFNKKEINSIAKRYKELRNLSKAPTFRSYLRRMLQNPDEQLWF